jgi:multisubunit Na+/H+ antiporter MnhE subunit
MTGVPRVGRARVARAFEDAGIPNVIIMSTVFKDRTAAMKPARILLTPHPMGRPLLAPFDAEKQRDVLKAVLALLDTATAGGTVVEYGVLYRTGPFDA